MYPIGLRWAHERSLRSESSSTVDLYDGRRDPRRAARSLPDLFGRGAIVPVYVALLRGINVAGKRRVAMADLRSWLTGLGYADVRTLSQSGNAVFRTGKRPDTVVRELEARLADGAGFEIDCVIRTAAELRAVVEANPLGAVATNPSRYLVSFLAAPMSWPAIDPAAYEPERFHLAEREAYIWVPDGIQDSKVVNAFPLKKGTTIRNWNTVTKLLALAET